MLLLLPLLILLFVLWHFVQFPSCLATVQYIIAIYKFNGPHKTMWNTHSFTIHMPSVIVKINLTTSMHHICMLTLNTCRNDNNDVNDKHRLPMRVDVLRAVRASHQFNKRNLFTVKHSRSSIAYTHTRNNGSTKTIKVK